jgi:site-specific DNA-methyltransferase (adenine-specific)
VFPIDLPRRCIEAAAVPAGGIVCDPFMGSGTTARAAVEAGVHFLGFDIAAGGLSSVS